MDRYIAALPAKQRKIAIELRRMIGIAAPKSEEAVKWNYPWYIENGYVCYISGQSGYVNLGFARGAELDDPKGLLEGAGKGMRHVKVHSLDELQDTETRLKTMIRQAVKLNRESGSKRGR